MSNTSKEILNKAHLIASTSLRKCYTSDGIIAGTHHFVDIWGRDALFASLGSLTLGDFDIVKTTLHQFITHQKNDGQIPYRLMRSKTTIGKYFGHPTFLKELKAEFRSRQSGGTVLDVGLLLIIVCSKYVEKTNDIQFLRDNYDSLRKTIEWYKNKSKNGLLWEWFQCGWEDAVFKSGYTFYTNILYWIALDSIKKMGSYINDSENVVRWAEQQDKLKATLDIRFYNGHYYIDWIDYKNHNFFDAYANFLAVVFNFVDGIKVNSIIEFVQKNTVLDFTVLKTYPALPKRRIPVINYLVGMGDYQNGFLWLQPGLMYCIALLKLGLVNEARDRLLKVSEKFIEYDEVFEVFEKDGTPVNRLQYKSEKDFAWNAGLFIWAYDLLESTH